MKHLLVFLLLVVVDFAWSYYVNCIKDGKAHAAASWSAFMMALQGYAAVNYVNDPQLLAAAIAGAWVGTYVGVWWQKVEIITPVKEGKQNADDTNKDSIGPG